MNILSIFNPPHKRLARKFSAAPEGLNHHNSSLPSAEALGYDLPSRKRDWDLHPSPYCCSG